MNASEPITAVVTAHDPGPFLDEVLRGLVGDSRLDEILVVDSGSTDGSVDEVAARHPGVRLIRLGHNLGPCATRNRGLFEARTPLVLFLDDDMVLAPDALDHLIAALEKAPEVAMVGPSIADARAPERVLYEGGVQHFGGQPHLLNHGRAWRPAPPHRVDVLTAGCLLGRKEALEAAGGFDPTFFFLMEDVEFSVRLRLLGHELAVVPRARAWNGGHSEGLSLGRGRYPARRVYLHARNRWLLLLGTTRGATLLLLFWPLVFLEGAWFLFAGAKGELGAYLRGKRAFFANWRAVLAARRRLGRRRKIRDGAVLGCPSLTFTKDATAGGWLARAGTILDGTLRLLYRPVERWL